MTWFKTMIFTFIFLLLFLYFLNLCALTCFRIFLFISSASTLCVFSIGLPRTSLCVHFSLQILYFVIGARHPDARHPPSAKVQDVLRSIGIAGKFRAFSSAPSAAVASSSSSSSSAVPLASHSSDPPLSMPLSQSQSSSSSSFSTGGGTSVSVGGLSSAAFRFLFQPLAAQLWRVLMGYTNAAGTSTADRNEMLRFLFRLR